MKNDIQFLALGCRLNTVEAEKIKHMLTTAGLSRAVILNTCSVTAEAERQSKQALRKMIRENPNTPVFVTGCAVTRDAESFAEIKGVTAAIVNKDKFKIQSYLPDMAIGESISSDGTQIALRDFTNLSKAFVQIQNGCNHSCAYCIVSSLRGKNVSFPYDKILNQARALACNGYNEIVLTGVDIAGYILKDSAGNVLLSDLCMRLLADVPEIKRLRLSSLDPGVNLRPVIDIMKSDARMLPHIHLSMQSGSDAVLGLMGRRHNAQMVRDLVNYAGAEISFSWDLICGFPGETDELFAETCDLIRELGPIHLHAFPFSPRPGTAAATMPGQVDKQISKKRVKIVTDLARENRLNFMKKQIGKTVSVLTEENNMARDAHDIAVRISGPGIPARQVMNVKLADIVDDEFISCS